MKYFSFFLLLGFIPLSLAGCGGLSPAEAPPTTSMNFAIDQTIAPQQGEKIAVLKTSKGVIKMKFFSDEAPETVKNFQELAKKGFFNGLIFHRVIPDFMIQGGDPTGTGMGGETYKGLGTTIPGEVSAKLHHIHGAVAMANKGGDPSTATSQFFIVQNKKGTPFLDGGYTIFGQVFEGFDVVDQIAAAERDKKDDKPLSPVKMNEVNIEE